MCTLFLARVSVYVYHFYAQRGECTLNRETVYALEEYQDAAGTPTQSHISTSILAYKEHCHL